MLALYVRSISHSFYLVFPYYKPDSDVGHKRHSNLSSDKVNIL